MFVQLASESRVGLIRRNGISRLRKASVDRLAGVFAVPSNASSTSRTGGFRELKRRGQGAIFGVYVRLRDDEPVWVGHYGQSHRRMTTAEAVAEFLGAESREGWEVIIPRRIAANEIHRVRSLPQVVGWRYDPGARGKSPYCTCK